MLTTGLCFAQSNVEHLTSTPTISVHRDRRCTLARRVCKKVKRGAETYTNFFDRLARGILRYKSRLLCMDANMALFCVVPELRARGVMASMAAFFLSTRTMTIRLKSTPSASTSLDVGCFRRRLRRRPHHHSIAVFRRHCGHFCSSQPGQIPLQPSAVAETVPR